MHWDNVSEILATMGEVGKESNKCYENIAGTGDFSGGPSECKTKLMSGMEDLQHTKNISFVSERGSHCYILGVLEAFWESVLPGVLGAFLENVVLSVRCALSYVFRGALCAQEHITMLENVMQILRTAKMFGKVDGVPAKRVTLKVTS